MEKHWRDAPWKSTLRSVTGGQVQLTDGKTESQVSSSSAFTGKPKNNAWLAETQGSNITDSSCAPFSFRFPKGQLALSKAGRLYFSSSNVILANSLHSRSSKPERDMLVFSRFSPVWLFVTPCTVSRQTPQSMGFSSGKNTGVGCHALLQGIFSN